MLLTIPGYGVPFLADSHHVNHLLGSSFFLLELHRAEMALFASDALHDKQNIFNSALGFA